MGDTIVASAMGGAILAFWIVAVVLDEKEWNPNGRMGRSSLLVDVPKPKAKVNAKAKERSQRKAKEKPKKSQRKAKEKPKRGQQRVGYAKCASAQGASKTQDAKAVNPLASFWNWTERRNHKGKAGPVRMGLSD